MAPGVTHEEDFNAQDSLDSERNSTTNTPDRVELKAIRVACNDPQILEHQDGDTSVHVLAHDKNTKTDKPFTAHIRSDGKNTKTTCESPLTEPSQLENALLSDFSGINLSNYDLNINCSNGRSIISEGINKQNGFQQKILIDSEEKECHADDSEQSEAVALLERKKDVKIENGNAIKESDDDVAEETTKAPDGGWGWLIILGALLLRVIIGGIGRSHGLFYIKFRERYDGSATATAFVTALTGIFRLAGGPFVSILCSRFKCRYLTLIGACLLCIGLILTGFSPSLQFLYFSYGVICGLGRAFALTPVPILLGYYFDKRRSLAFGLASAGFSIGGFGVTPTVEIMFQTFGFQGTYLLLGGLVLNILVCSALFRPIELHRRLTRIRPKHQSKNECIEKILVKSLEDIQSGHILSSSTISIERIRTTSRSISKDSSENTHEDSVLKFAREQFTKTNRNSNADYSESEFKLVTNSINSDVSEHTDSKDDLSYCANVKKNDASELGDNGDEHKAGGKGETEKLTKMNQDGDSTSNAEEKSKKQPLIAWSILKDIRFLCFCLSNFLLTLPSSGLFLPSLAIARGASELQAATLLSINAGCDTVFRVISGFVLDLKLFREYRPQIYSTVVVIQGIVNLLYPLMTSYTGFVVLCLTDGAFSGIKSAQNSVVVMDILGVDKLASSMAITMSVQAVALLIGPTISGQLRDISGVYDGAFYFGGAAIILGGLVMTGGNIRKYLMDRRKKERENQTEEGKALTNSV